MCFRNHQAPQDIYNQSQNLCTMSEISIKSLCCTCLSTDRKLIQLCRILDGINLLYTLLTHDPIAYKEGFFRDAASLLVCWECAAIINRIRRFTTQACLAQKQLASIVDERNVILQTLSRLKTVPIRTPHYKLQASIPDTAGNFIDCGAVIKEVKSESDSESDDIPLSALCYENDIPPSALYYENDKPLSTLCNETDKPLSALCYENDKPLSALCYENDKPLSALCYENDKSLSVLCYENDKPLSALCYRNDGNYGKSNKVTSHSKNSNKLHDDCNILKSSKTQIDNNYILSKNSSNQFDNCPKILENSSKVISNDLILSDNNTNQIVNSQLLSKNSVTQYDNSHIPPELSTIKHSSSNQTVEKSSIEIDNTFIPLEKSTKQFDNNHIPNECGNIQFGNHDKLSKTSPITQRIKSTSRKRAKMKFSEYVSLIILNEEEMLKSMKNRKADLEKYAAFSCDKCVLGFKSENELNGHNEKLHTKKDNFSQCDICHSYIEDLPTHRQSHYYSYICVLCTHTEFTHTDVVRHLKREHYEICCVKGKGSRSKRKKQCLEDTKYPCAECEMIFQNKDLRWKHVQKAHRQGFKCSSCDKKFAFKNNLERHERTHGGPLPREQCPTCHKMIRLDLMKVHSRIHAHRQTHTCVECDKHFVSRQTYESHLKYARAHATGEVCRHKCPMCEKRYRSRGELTDHVNYQHKRQADHKCPICGKGLATKRCIRRHVRRAHEGIKESARDKICHQCGKAFRDKKGLIEHERVHSGARPLTCTACGRAFRQRAALYAHCRRMHTTTG